MHGSTQVSRGLVKLGSCGLVALVLAGCSYSPMNRLTLFPQGHNLLPATKELKRAATEPAPLPRELDKHVLAPFTAEPGDVLLVQVADIDSPIRIPGDQTVLLDGTINLGRYGFLIVAGKTLPAIEGDIRAQIQAQNNNKDPGPISVRVLTQQGKVYYVLGEVNVPGAFALKGRETVLDGIIAAGGLTDKGSRRNIILSRPTPPDNCRVVLPICYREIVQLGDTATNYQLAPGDRIYVASRSFAERFSDGKKKNCGPCGRGQFPCTIGACGDGGQPLPTIYHQPQHGIPAPAQAPEPLAAPRQ